MMKHRKFKWQAIAIWLLTCLSLQTKAQEADDLQAYLDQLAVEQTAEQTVQQSRQNVRRGVTVTIPVGLTEVDLSKFTSYQNRTKTLELKASVQFINGTISAASTFSGGGCLLKIYNGVQVVLDNSAGVNAAMAANINCLAAVGIYGGSAFYQQGDITAPANGTGIAIYLDGATDVYNYVSGTTTGTISNLNGGTVNGVGGEQYTYAGLKEKLDNIGAKVNSLNTSYSAFAQRYNTLASYLTEADQQYLAAQIALVKGKVDALVNRHTTLGVQLEQASANTYPNINTSIETLDADVEAYKNLLPTEIVKIEEAAIVKAATDIQHKLNAFATSWTNVMEAVIAVKDACNSMVSATGDGYFLKKTTVEFSSASQTLSNKTVLTQNSMMTLQNDYNTTVIQISIASIEDAVRIYQQYNVLYNRLDKLRTDSQDETTELGNVQTLFNALTMQFPDCDKSYNIIPAELTEIIQMGYKSNRGFVLTSSGMMQFEQVSGANFRLKDYENHYIVAVAGTTVLKAGTQEEATIWTGQNYGNGQYAFYSSNTSSYLSYEGYKINSTIKVSNTAFAWTIAESDLDDLQAFLNLLAEEEEESESGSDLSEKDTLTIAIPQEVPCTGCYTAQWVFPKTPYPIKLVMPKRGDWTLPLPKGGGRRPEAFHPMRVPEGSHVILDDIDFPADAVGGHHIIYVEGTVEVNVNVTVAIDGWDWFAHVGPKGRLIWHPKPKGGATAPRIKNEGTLDMPEGELAQVENTGTVNHSGGTVVKVVNRKVYHFTGGIINDLQNYGEHHQSSGTVLTASNYADGTVRMSGGSIVNTVVNVVETVFVNYGKFYFTGGIIGGYGKQLIYHGKGGFMRIDGGQFDFSHVKDYWIEAHDDFYIPGNYDFKPTVPMLIEAKVIVRVLYKWIYKFNIVFVGGRPEPRHPLFWGDDFTLIKDHFKFIDWQLPNKRWRWHLNVADNTIEPRDEQVMDEDDLKAYVTWLDDNKTGEAASTETSPQELDLQERTIVITEPVYLPVGCHVYIKDGNFAPKGSWTTDKMFYVPSGSSMKMENTVVDLSSSVHYIVSGKPVQRYIFDVVGNLHFGPGCHIKGWIDNNIAPTDSYIPGAVVRIDPNARLYLDGGRMDDVVIYVNSVVNIYVTVNWTSYLNVYVPVAYRKTGFRFMAPQNGFAFTRDGLKQVRLLGAGGWTARPDATGYASLLEVIVGDVDESGVLDATDVTELGRYLGGKPSPSFLVGAADFNKDGVVNIIDIVQLIKQVMRKP